ncbi:MAG: RluA family pseudouridine synthase [Rhodospirillales bacterium]|nr:RluA family pseudouridine synthase [Rhodospirillales bacterium]
MGGVQILTVKADEAGLRLDRWLKKRFPDVGHGRVQKWLRTGQVRLDGRRAKAGVRLVAGQRVRVPPLGAAPPRVGPPRPAYSDADMQGGSGIRRHLDAMLAALRFDADQAPRLVHRLDRDTSGVLVLARTAEAARLLTSAFRSKDARKLYWAVVVGVPRPAEGIVDLALAKGPGRGGERIGVAEDGKKAITYYRVIDHAGRKAAWVAFEPLTGRTHQIRVHAAALGTPVLGDGKYGGRAAFLKGDSIAKRLHLHARAIRMPHPAGGMLEAEAPLPPHMRATFKALGFNEKTRADPFYNAAIPEML